MLFYFSLAEQAAGIQDDAASNQISKIVTNENNRVNIYQNHNI